MPIRRSKRGVLTLAHRIPRGRRTCIVKGRFHAHVDTYEILVQISVYPEEHPEYSPGNCMAILYIGRSVGTTCFESSISR